MHFVLTVLGEISELAACNGPNEGRMLALSVEAVSSAQISLWNEPNILELTQDQIGNYLGSSSNPQQGPIKSQETTIIMLLM